MELNKEFVRVRCLSADGITASGDYTLPDYQGDVRRILYSSVDVEDGGRYHNRESLDCAGSVVFKIVYLDSDGRVTPVSFPADYDFSVKCSDEHYVDSEVKTRVESFGLRLMGPRRFSAKCMLSADVIITERSEYRVEREEAGELEVKRSSVEVAGAQFYHSGEREMAEELAVIDGAILDEVEILTSSATPSGVSVSRSDGGALVLKSGISVRALVKNAEEAPVLYESVMELTEVIEAEGIGEGATLVPSVSVVSESVSLSASENGVGVVSSIIVEAAVRAEHSSEVEVIKDCFSKERELECREGELAYTRRVGTRLIDEKYSHAFARCEVGAENVRNVLYENARVKIDGCECGERELKISGTIHVGAIACEIDEEGAPNYAPLRFESKFTVNANFNCQIPQKNKAIVNISLEGIHIDIDGDSLTLSGNLCGAASVYAEEREPCITAVTMKEEHPPRRSDTVSVYYPVAGESLFDVGKKFHIPVMEIAQENELSLAVISEDGASLSACGVPFLIIK